MSSSCLYCVVDVNLVSDFGDIMEVATSDR